MLGLLITGSLLFFTGLNIQTDLTADTATQYLICIWSGLFFMGVPTAYCYCKASTDPKGLKILDWACILFTLFIMPLFEALGIQPVWWLLVIMLPALICDVVFRKILTRSSRVK